MFLTDDGLWRKTERYIFIKDRTLLEKLLRKLLGKLDFYFALDITTNCYWEQVRNYNEIAVNYDQLSEQLNLLNKQ